MDFYGISGIVNKLMRSYLENRHQRVTMKDIKLIIKYLLIGNM